jgi:hypothetical protein
MKLHLNILPEAQLKLWPQLKAVPENFVLYGGTAIALQLGHRISVDFDFFSKESLDKNVLLKVFPLLAEHKMVQPEINTVNSFIDLPEGMVKLQFLAGLGERQKQIAPVSIAEDNGIQIASLQDLFATKLNTIQHRAECKDYIDIDALIQIGKISLEEGLAYAIAVYGQSFDPATSLRALCSYREGDLSELEPTIKKRLSNAAINVNEIPTAFGIWHDDKRSVDEVMATLRQPRNHE